MTNNELEQWADSRETSFEVASAIEDFCNSDIAKMQNEFEDAFNADEIMENAFNISTEIVLFWGCKVFRQTTNKIVQGA